MDVYEKNQKFNNMTITGKTKRIGKRLYYQMKCDCGNEKYIRSDAVKKTHSCGCERRNKVNLPTNEYEKLYNVWSNMIKRCYNENCDRYYTYGARGIQVCNEWKNNFQSFAKWAVNNGWKCNLSIERKDHDGNYCPENCTFITMAEQAKNKTNNVNITYNGETKCIAEWCEIIGLDAKTAYARYARGHREPEVILYKGDLRELRK